MDPSHNRYLLETLSVADLNYVIYTFVFSIVVIVRTLLFDTAPVL